MKNYSKFALTVSAVALTASLGWTSLAFAQAARPATDRETFVYRDLSTELANKMTGDYTLALAGDVLMQEPMGARISPEILDVLRNADTTVGNMETFIVDRRTWAGENGYGNNWAPKEVAFDWADMGFDLMAVGEMAGGPEGLDSSQKWMDEAGIKLAGYGPNLTIARQPAFQELQQGRVAMVYAYPVGPVGSPDDAARDKANNEGSERAGLNVLRLTQQVTVTAAQLEEIRAIRASMVERRDTEPGLSRMIDVPAERENSVEFLGKTYVLGDKPGDYKYVMNSSDKDAQILAVRGAKEYADFAIFSMHVHENRFVFQAYSQDHYPTDYVIELAHEMVDNGMDVYHGHGNHTMQGIEIYKGRPIFYNLGNFSVHRFGSDGTPDGGNGMTYIEDSEIGEHYFQQDPNLMAYVAEVDYKNGVASEVRVHPVELGLGKNRPWSRMNIPMKPSAADAQKILELIAEYSEPFGTEMEIRDGVGYITIDPSETVPVGTELRASFEE